MLVTRRRDSYLEPHEDLNCRKVLREGGRSFCEAVALAALGSGMGTAAVPLLSLFGPKVSLAGGALYGAVSYFNREHTIKYLERWSCIRSDNLLNEDPQDASLISSFIFECRKATVVAISVGLITGWIAVNLMETDSLTIPVAAMITGIELAMTYVAVGGFVASGVCVSSAPCSISWNTRHPVHVVIDQDQLPDPVPALELVEIELNRV